DRHDWLTPPATSISGAARIRDRRDWLTVDRELDLRPGLETAIDLGARASTGSGITGVRGGAAEAAAAPPASGIGGEGGEGASVDGELAAAPAHESAIAVNHPRRARTRPRPSRESAIAMSHSSPARTRSRPAR